MMIVNTVSFQVGMLNFHLNRNHKYMPTINVEKLWSLVSDRTRAKYVGDSKKAPVIDATRAGYFKASTLFTQPL